MVFAYVQQFSELICFEWTFAVSCWVPQPITSRWLPKPFLVWIGSDSALSFDLGTNALIYPLRVDGGLFVLRFRTTEHWCNRCLLCFSGHPVSFALVFYILFRDLLQSPSVYNLTSNSQKRTVCLRADDWSKFCCTSCCPVRNVWRIFAIIWETQWFVFLRSSLVALLAFGAEALFAVGEKHALICRFVLWKDAVSPRRDSLSWTAWDKSM